MKKLITIISLLICLQANSQGPQRFFEFGGTKIDNVSYEPDAQAYITAVESAGGTLTLTQKTAWNTFVLAAKGGSNPYWSNFAIINPIMGGTSASHAINAKNPATFTATYSGTVTHTSTHVVSNGTTGYMNTGYNPSVNDADGFGSMAVWVRNNIDATACVMGAISATNRYTQIYPRFGNTLYGQYNTNNSIAETQTFSTSVGFSLVSRTGSTAIFTQRDATQVGSTTSTAITNNNIYVLAQNVNGTAGNFTTYQVCMYMIADTPLTTAQASQFYTDFSTFITAVGR